MNGTYEEQRKELLETKEQINNMRIALEQLLSELHWDMAVDKKNHQQSIVLTSYIVERLYDIYFGEV